LVDRLDWLGAKERALHRHVRRGRR